MVAAAPLLTGAAVAASVSQRPSPVSDRNRRIVQAFADLFYRQHRVRDAFNAYVAADYIQHNPGLPDGRDAAIQALTPMFSNPGATFEIKRILVDGNMAAIHLYGRGDPATKGAAVVDLYRLEGGKIVEHWDVIQPMPAKSDNPHPMF